MRLRRPGRKAIIATGSVLTVVWLIGLASEIGDSISEDAARSARQDSSLVEVQELPPAPPSARVINRTTTVTHMPQSCIDYLNLVDRTIQSVYDYEDGIGPSNQVLSDALEAMVNSDPAALNRARTELNKVQNATTGPLQVIVDSHPELVASRAACDKDLGR